MRLVMNEKIIFKLFDVLRRVLWLSLRYPAYSSSYIARNIKRTATSREELEVYESHCTSRSKVRTILLILVYVSYCLKNIYGLYELNNLHEYQHFERNIVQLNGTHKFISRCLVTNCTRLATSRLGEEANNLPIFSLCNPLIDSLYTPIIKLDSAAILYYSLTFYTILILSSYTPIRQLIAPAATDWIMLVAAPRVTIEVARAEAQKFLIEFARSYDNYKIYLLTAMEINNKSRLKHHWPRRASERVEVIVDDNQVIQIANKSASLYTHQTRGKVANYSRIASQNCVPIVRSFWWRPKVIRVFAFTLLYTLTYELSIFLFLQFQINSRSKAKTKLLSSYAHEMQTQNCFIWNKFEPQEPIDLATIQVNWNNFTLVLEFLMNFGPDLALIILASSFWVLMSEAAICLAELRMFLVTSLLATRIYNLNRRPLAIKHNYQQVQPLGFKSQLLASLQSIFTITQLRRHFRESLVSIRMSPFVCIRHEKSLKHFLVNSMGNDRYYEQEFINRISHQLAASTNFKRQLEEFNIETLEQIYVNFRLYVNYVHSLRPTVAIFLAIIYSLNYGYVLIAVIIKRNIANISMHLILSVILFAYSIATLLIYLCANVHANTKKLQPLIWSIMAELTQWESMRARHLRQLWLKQMKMLDNEGGLALMAFGMRVTYVYIFQIMISTATIFVIALKED